MEVKSFMSFATEANKLLKNKQEKKRSLNKVRFFYVLFETG